MHIAAIALGGRALSWALWHLAYIAGGHGQRDLEIAERLRRYAGRQDCQSAEGDPRQPHAVTPSSQREQAVRPALSVFQMDEETTKP